MPFNPDPHVSKQVAPPMFINLVAVMAVVQPTLSSLPNT